MAKIYRITDNAILPKKKHKNDAGFDIYTSSNLIVPPHRRGKANTGISIQFDRGTCGIIKPRSGISLNSMVFRIPGTKLTTEAYISVIDGTIDEGYTGEIGIIVHNHSDHCIEIPKHTRLAQLIIIPVVYCDLIESEEPFKDKDRGDKGFGSTGIY